MNTVDSWRRRPDAVTRIPNLFLASDYVKTHTDLATMEGANEAARRAVNGILAAKRLVRAALRCVAARGARDPRRREGNGRPALRGRAAARPLLSLEGAAPQASRGVGSARAD